MPPRVAANERISSLLKKPDVPGNPASARAPQISTAQVKGIALRKPPIRSTFCSAAIAAMIEPAAMKSRALKKACVIRWKRPAL